MDIITNLEPNNRKWLQIPENKIKKKGKLKGNVKQQIWVMNITIDLEFLQHKTQ